MAGPIFRYFAGIHGMAIVYSHISQSQFQNMQDKL